MADQEMSAELKALVNEKLAEQPKSATSIVRNGKYTTLQDGIDLITDEMIKTRVKERIADLLEKSLLLRDENTQTIRALTKSLISDMAEIFGTDSPEVNTQIITTAGYIVWAYANPYQNGDRPVNRYKPS